MNILCDLSFRHVKIADFGVGALGGLCTENTTFELCTVVSISIYEKHNRVGWEQGRGVVEEIAIYFTDNGEWKRVAVPAHSLGKAAFHSTYFERIS
tara:strand:- start:231 stop:518 length:288 start_codon:yes stop_codon:yes gene_type:complete